MVVAKQSQDPLPLKAILQLSYSEDAAFLNTQKKLKDAISIASENDQPLARAIARRNNLHFCDANQQIDDGL